MLQKNNLSVIINDKLIENDQLLFPLRNTKKCHEYYILIKVHYRKKKVLHENT